MALTLIILLASLGASLALGALAFWPEAER